MATREFWVRIEGRGYFVRFKSYVPQATWSYTSNWDLGEAYCFPSQEDAQRVVDQLRTYGRKATVVVRRPTPPPPPPPAPFWAPPSPPESLRYWVDKILELGNKTGSAEDRIRSGYRALARQCHPDVGGTTTQMQAVGEAAAWLRANKAAVDVPGSEPFASSLWDDEIPFDGDDAPFGGFDEAPITQLDDDDIPF